MDILNSLMTVFGEYTLYIYAAVAILYFWKTKDGKRLYETLLEKLDDKPKNQSDAQPAPTFLSASQEEVVLPKVQPLEQVEMPRVSEGVRAVGITLVNQDLAELTIKNQPQEVK